jgi:hypothetical protein
MKLAVNRGTEVTPRQLRQFGIILGTMVFLAGGWFWWRGIAVGAVAAASSPFVMIAFWRQWPGTHVFFRCWMALAGFMGNQVARLLLIVVYCLILTPLAVLARICGKEFICTRFGDSCDSYWQSAKDNDHNFPRQY